MRSVTLPNPFPVLVGVPGIAHLAFSADGIFRVASDTALGLRVYRGDDLVWERTFDSDNDKLRPTLRIRSVATAGSHLLVAAGDTVYDLDLRTSAELWTYTPPRSWAFLISSPLAVAAEGDQVVASFDNGTMGMWGADRAKRTVRSFNDAPRWLTLTPTRIVGSDGFSVSTWDRETLAPRGRHRIPDRIYDFAATDEFAAFTTIHAVERWSIAESRVVQPIRTNVGKPAIAFDAHGTLGIAQRGSLTLVHRDGTSETYPVDDSPTPLCLTAHPVTGDWWIGTGEGRVVPIPTTA